MEPDRQQHLCAPLYFSFLFVLVTIFSRVGTGSSTHRLRDQTAFGEDRAVRL